MKMIAKKSALAVLVLVGRLPRLYSLVTVHPTKTTTTTATTTGTVSAASRRSIHAPIGTSTTRLLAAFDPRTSGNSDGPRRSSSSRRRNYSNSNDNGNGAGRYSGGTSGGNGGRYKFDKRSEQSDSRNAWLRQATDTILKSEPGSLLQQGKWHELISLIKGWSRFAKYDSEAPIFIEQLLKRLLDERRAGFLPENDHLDIDVDIDLYNYLLDAWACAALCKTQNPVKASQRAREILVNLQQNYERSCNSNGNGDNGDSLRLRPDAHSFSLVFHTVCEAEGPTVTRRLVAWMEYLYKVGKNDTSKPSWKQYLKLLNAYANSRTDNAGQLAEGFLRHMRAVGAKPDTCCYNIAIKAWSKSKRGRETAEHVDRILEEMDVPKDLVTYSTAIAAWAASGMRSHAVERAEELLKDIEASPDLEPNTIVFNTVMSTWVKSRNPAAVKRTGELLKQMESSPSSSPARPDLVSYNTHLHALSIHGKKRGSAQEANDLLFSMRDNFEKGKVAFRPNQFSYNLVIDAWSRSQEPDAAWNAVRVLRALIDDDVAQPDTFSFNQALAALSRTSKSGAASMAERLLDYMDNGYRLGILKYAKPDVVGYTSVIIALARSREADAAQRAEQLLEELKTRYLDGERALKPNRMCYNSLIDCWAKSGKGTLAARKAEALLQEMEEICASGDSSVSPNIVTYNAVLNSWARSGTRCCGNKAEEYLGRMWDRYHAGDGNIAPDDKSFNTVINAISESQNAAKAQKALRILRRMDKLYQSGYKEARPNEVTYTSVLKSCAFPASYDPKIRRKALDTAIFTLQELQSSRYGHPNDVTYGTFIKACATLLSDDEEALRAILGQAFEQCRQDGQVGEIVLSHIRDAAPDDLYKELFAEILASTHHDNDDDDNTVTSDNFATTSSSSSFVNIDDIPLEWRCNVRVGKVSRSQQAHGRGQRFSQQEGQRQSVLRRQQIENSKKKNKIK